MGGQLFGLGRLDAAEYKLVEQQLIEYLTRLCGEGNFLIPRYYRAKPNFGDVDVLISKSKVPSWTPELINQIINDLQISQHKRDKHILSLAYQNKIQVDFSIIPESELRSNWQFLCYNDLGNLLGKMYRRFNLKYGEKGIFYVYRRSESAYRKDVLLTTDMEKILGFLELSFAEWDAGFETLDEMFGWVVNCKYFTVAPFKNLAASTSKRAKVRTTVQKFLEYIERHQIDKCYPYAEKNEYLPKIIEYFAQDIDLATLIENERQLELRENVIREKFNGNMVMEIFPELQGPSLGLFMKEFRSTFANFNDEIYSMPSEAIRQRILDVHERISTQPSK